MPLLKERVIDCSKQGWFAKISKRNKSTHNLYKLVKTKFGNEEYLDKLPRISRSFIYKLRISAHSLYYQTGRVSRNRLPRYERLCHICQNGEVEDVFHFSLICQKYNSRRQNYLDKYLYDKPIMFEFIFVLSMFGNYLTSDFSNYSTVSSVISTKSEVYDNFMPHRHLSLYEGPYLH